MILNKGDLVWRNRFISPVYIVHDIKDDLYILKAITLTKLTLRVIREVGGEEVHHLETMNFHKMLQIQKDFFAQVHVSKLWAKISTTEIQEHPLFDQGLWDLARKRYKLIIPKDRYAKWKRKNLDIMPAVIVKYNGMEMYSSDLPKQKITLSERANLKQARARLRGKAKNSSRGYRNS